MGMNTLGTEKNIAMRNLRLNIGENRLLMIFIGEHSNEGISIAMFDYHIN